MSDSRLASAKGQYRRPSRILHRPRWLSSYLLGATVFFLLAAAVGPLSFLKDGRWAAIGLLAVYWSLSSRVAFPASRPGQTHLTVLICVYLTICALSAALSVNPYLSGCRFIAFAALVVGIMLLARLRLRCGEAREWVHVLLLLLMIGAPAVALMPSRTVVGWHDSSLFRGGAGDANTMGHVTALGLLAILFIWARLGKQDRRKAYTLVAAVALGAVLLATKARSSAFSVAVRIWVALPYLPRLRKTLLYLVLFGTGALLVAGGLRSAISDFIFKTSTPSAQEYPGDMDTSSAGGAVTKVFASRTPQWERSWDAIWKRPILGWGFGATESTPQAWTFRLSAIGMMEEVNNDFLHTAESVGILGMILHLAVILTVLVRFRPPPRCPNFEWVVVYCLACALWANLMLDGATHAVGSLTSGLFWILLGLTACPAIHGLTSQKAPSSRLRPPSPAPRSPRFAWRARSPCAWQGSHATHVHRPWGRLG